MAVEDEDRLDGGEGTDDSRMTLVEHLTELRRRLVVALVAIAAGAAIVFVLYEPVIGFLSAPYEDITDKRLIFIDPLEGFTTRLKVATYGGLALAAPIVLWQVWRFVTPGLHPHEKRYAIPFTISATLLFVLGGVVAWLTVPQALGFLLGVGGDSLEASLTAAKYLSLISLMIVAFGVAFEFPVLLVFLLLAGVITTDTLRRGRRYAIVGIVVFAAIITPSQDPYSLLLLSAPLYLFYEVSILIGRLMKR